MKFTRLLCHNKVNKILPGSSFRIFFQLLFLGMENEELEIKTALNDDLSYSIYHPVQVGVKYRIRIQQTYKSNGLYQYTVFINGQQIHTAENTNAQQFYNVHVFLTRGGKTVCDVTISNFEITNFL